MRVGLQVSKHQQAYMHVAHALLSWHMGTCCPPDTPRRARSGQTHWRLQPHDQQELVCSDTSQIMQLSTDTAADSGSRGHFQALQPAASCSQGVSHQQNHRGLPSQQVQVGQLNQMHGLQQSTHPVQSQCQQEHGTDDKPQGKSNFLGQRHASSMEDVELSCSLDEDMVPALDLQSSAVSKLMLSTAGQLLADDSDALSDQSQGCSAICQASMMGADDMTCITSDAITDTAVGDGDLPSTALAIRTRKFQPSHEQQQCTSLQQEMAASPSAVQGRRKQARLDSMRCLKF